MLSVGGRIPRRSRENRGFVESAGLRTALISDKGGVPAKTERTPAQTASRMDVAFAAGHISRNQELSCESVGKLKERV